MTLPRIEIAVDPAAHDYVASRPSIDLYPFIGMDDECNNRDCFCSPYVKQGAYDEIDERLEEAFRAGATWAAKQASPR